MARKTAPSSPQPAVTICATPRCGEPAIDAVICWRCHDQLRDDLREIAGQDGQPGLVDELLVTMTMQAESDRAGYTLAEPDLDHEGTDEPIATTPLPYDPGAGEALRALHAELSTWCRHLIESRWPYPIHADGHYRYFAPEPQLGAVHGPWRPLPSYPRDEPKALARWLLEHLASIRQDEAGGELVEAIAQRVKRARPSLDPIAELEYLGPCIHCDCDTKRCRGGHPEPTDLYVPRGVRQARCPICGASWPVEARRVWLLDQARPVLLTATEATRALAGLLEDTLAGRPLTASMIRNWGARGRLTKHRPHPRDWDVDEATGEPIEPAPRYQVGELLDLLIRLKQDEVKRQEQRHAC